MGLGLCPDPWEVDISRESTGDLETEVLLT